MALQTHVSVLQRTEEAHFSPRADTSSGNQSRCPSHASLGHETGMVEVENDVGRMGHHLWETHKNTKPRNAICSHRTIQGRRLTLCHLHRFVLDHLGELPLSETDDELQTHSEWAVRCPFVSLARADAWGLFAAGLACTAFLLPPLQGGGEITAGPQQVHNRRLDLVHFQ